MHSFAYFDQLWHLFQEMQKYKLFKFVLQSSKCFSCCLWEQKNGHGKIAYNSLNQIKIYQNDLIKTAFNMIGFSHLRTRSKKIFRTKFPHQSLPGITISLYILYNYIQEYNKSQYKPIKEMKTKCKIILFVILVFATFCSASKKIMLSNKPIEFENLGCGGQIGLALNYFDICTQQHPNNIQVTAQCIESSMNGYYATQRWEVGVIGNNCNYAFWVTVVDGCLAQQHSFGINRWDYFAWRIR